MKDDFKAQELKEASEVLDIMRLSKDDQYGYNRYLDSLHLKANEIFTLQNEAEFKVREDIAKKLIINNVENTLISISTNLSIERIEELGTELGE